VSAVLEKGIFTSDEILARIENALSRKKRWMSESQHLVQRAMVFIHDHYKESLSRADIANYLCINEQYLSRCFKNEIGIGPMNYLSRYRIAQAKKLLERQDLSITQIALAVGLSSQSYFSRLFYLETGVSPSAYRRGERKDTG
jgi:two-component system response regulator YesN